MKLIEAKQQIDRLIEQGYSENSFCIPVQGIGGARVEVTGFAPGFDWTHGSVLVYTKQELSTIDIRKHSKLKELYLSKISNLRQIELEKTKVARYKKEEKTFEKKWEAVIWLYDKLKEDLKEE